MTVQIVRKLKRTTTALLIVDVQRGFDLIEESGVGRNNPDAIDQIARLLTLFRAESSAIFHIRHAGTDINSYFRPDEAGFPVKDAAREVAGEPVIVKRVNSAFIGTDLEAQLRKSGTDTLVICGATTNHCVETTVRMAGNLEFDVWLVRDAIWTYDRTGPDGDRYLADDIHAMSLANLSDEFARVVRTSDVRFH
ncbi:MAG: cysteine hydrolase family protein [Ferrimicrobium sp.]